MPDIVSADFVLMDGLHDDMFDKTHITLAGGPRMLINAFARGCTQTHNNPATNDISDLNWRTDPIEPDFSIIPQNQTSYFANNKFITETNMDAELFKNLKGAGNNAHPKKKPTRKSIIEFFKLHTFEPAQVAAAASAANLNLTDPQLIYIQNWLANTQAQGLQPDHWNSWERTSIRGVSTAGGVFNYSNRMCKFRYFSHGLMPTEKNQAGVKFIKDIDYNDIFSKVNVANDGRKHIFIISDCGSPFVGGACRYTNYTTQIHIHCIFSNATFSDAKSSESPKTKHYGFQVDGHCSQMMTTAQGIQVPAVKKWAHVYIHDDNWAQCDKFGLLNFTVHREAYHKTPQDTGLGAVQPALDAEKTQQAGQQDTSNPSKFMHDFESRSNIRWAKTQNGIAPENDPRFNPQQVADTTEPTHSTKIRSGKHETRTQAGFVLVPVPAQPGKADKEVWQMGTALRAAGPAGMRNAIRRSQQKRLGDHGAIRECKWIQLPNNYNAAASFHITLPDYTAANAQQNRPWEWWIQNQGPGRPGLQDVRAEVQADANDPNARPNPNNTFFLTGDYPAFNFAIFNRINSIKCVNTPTKGYFVAVYDQ